MPKPKLHYPHEHTAYTYNVDLDIEKGSHQRLTIRLLQAERVADAVRSNLRGIVEPNASAMAALLEHINQECHGRLLIRAPGMYEDSRSNGRPEQKHLPHWEVTLSSLGRSDSKEVVVEQDGKNQHDPVAAVAGALRRALPELLAWITTDS